MINYLVKSLEFDLVYSVNSFIYILRGLPILKDLFTDDIYKSSFLKRLVSIFMTLFFMARSLFLKFSYFFVIFVTCYEFFPKTFIKSYFHIYFVLTIIGMFINNKLLNSSKKKYFSIALFKMNANKFAKATLLWNQLSNLLLNSICIFTFGYLIKSPIIYSISLIVFTFFIRFIGEALSIMFFKKYHYIWYSNTKLYFSILIILLGIAALPYFDIYISLRIIIISTIITIVLGGIAAKYLFEKADYRTMYQRLFSIVNVMNTKTDKDYLRQAMVEVRDKDKKIDKSKIKGKKGYEFFNTIFFERHKEILLRSARKYSLILIGVYCVISYLMLRDSSFSNDVAKFLHNNLGWFVVIMYFINRGAIITQAMFFNCDHAMLNYNFYRNPKNLLGLFKKRLLTVSKVNLLPALVIVLGNIVLLLIGKKYDLLIIISMSLFIIFLSVFFSVHYLVIYYLLQPFNKDLEVRKISYSFVTLITYIVSYMATSITMNSLSFSVLGLIFTIFYIVLALHLVYKYAPKTFKL